MRMYRVVVFATALLIAEKNQAQEIAFSAAFDSTVLTLSELYDLNKLKETGLQMQRTEMVVHRASKGSSEADGQYEPYKAQLHDQLKYLWGAYHFARWDTVDREKFDDVAIRQARNLLFRVSRCRDKKNDQDKVLLVIAWYNYGKSDTFMPIDQLALLVGEIKRLTGCLPVLYTRQSFLTKPEIASQLNKPANSWITSCPLWINTSEQTAMMNIAPWKSWSLWDHSSTANSSEQRPELSVFFKSRGPDLDGWYNSYAWNYKFKTSRLFTNMNGKSVIEDLAALFKSKRK